VGDIGRPADATKLQYVNVKQGKVNDNQDSIAIQGGQSFAKCAARLKDFRRCFCTAKRLYVM
jgi:hypothetical protein